MKISMIFSLKLQIKDHKGDDRFQNDNRSNQIPKQTSFKLNLTHRFKNCAFLNFG